MSYNIERISEKLIDNIEDLLSEFDIEFDNREKHIMFACPVHGGDNKEGSSILKSDIGNWQCFTNQCHAQYGNSSGASIIQFVQAVLKTNFYEALKWCANFVEEDDNEIIEKPQDDVYMNLIKYYKPKNSTIELQKYTNRSKFKNILHIPSSYYIKRGYSSEILKKFDVGYCFFEKHPQYHRTVIPFYDESGEYIVGCSGRNIYERCNKCKYYHDQSVRCPITKEEISRASKWKHSYNFNSDSYLYNYWNAKDHIVKNNTVILVEGVGDVWRFEEAKIYNSVALLGAKFSTNQRLLLERAGVINIILATDNDEAGNNISRIIFNTYKHMFNIVRIKPNKKDVGEMSICDIKNIFGGI